MIENESPNKKVTTSRYLVSFIISYVSLFILIYFILVLLHLNQDFFAILMVIVLLLSIQFILRLIDYFFELCASREDWKKPQIKMSSCNKNSKKKSTWIQRRSSQLKNCIEPIFLYSLIFDFQLIQKGWNYAVENPEYQSNDEHDAIIIMEYSQFSREYFSISGLDLLLPFFIENKIKYRVYCCEKSETFFKIVNNPKTTTLWILGHGRRGGVRISNTIFSYSELVENLSKEAKNKKYVYQFHCNSGCETSLSEYIAKGRGFANYKRLTPYAIRGYIKNILRDESWKQSYILK